MRVYIMTDLEGVCGVMNFEDWCTPGARYYETGRELLTREVNAAIEGFLAGGAREIVVADGHGCGAVNGSLLHSAAELMRGWPRNWPFSLDDRKFDAMAHVGQHPKSGAVGGHLCHTGSFCRRDVSVNGVSIGEFGEMVLCASELGVPAIFASGDQAFAKEAEALAPGIETVWTKRGTQTDPGHGLPSEGYAKHNLAAVHLSPERARERIRAGAQRAIERARKERFGLVELTPPFKRLEVRRSDATAPPCVVRVEHPSSVIELLRAIGAPLPLDADPMELLGKP